MKPTLFYSWQNETDTKLNRYFIRDALEGAIKRLNGSEENLVLRLESDTTGAPGTPDIAGTIFSRIDQAHLFVCDVSIVSERGTGRPTCNANVLIELGYAAGRLGWPRVICLFNDALGFTVEELPFDLRSRRITRFVSSGAKDIRRDELRKLEDVCFNAIRSVIGDLSQQVPAREPSAALDTTVVRERDLGILTETFNTLSTDAFDSMLEQAEAGKVLYSALQYFERYHGYVTASSFHLFDSTLRDRVLELDAAWDAMLSHFNMFVPAASGLSYVMDQTIKRYTPELWDRSRKAFFADVDRLRAVYRTLISYVKATYPEIDLAKTNAEAERRFQAFEEYSRSAIEGA